MLIGANSGSFSAIQRTISHNLTVIREYDTPEAEIPSTFPVYPEGVVPVQSFKPEISGFIAGDDDVRFMQLMHRAPPGAYITLWHEGERKNENHAPNLIREMHARAQELVHKTNSKIHYGQIFTTYSSETGRVEDWVAPGMDFYGLDVYATAEDDTAGDAIYDTVNTIHKMAGSAANIMVTECNSMFVNSRQGFIMSCFQWAVDFDCPMFMVYYDPFEDLLHGSPYQWTSAPSDPYTMKQVTKP